MDKPSSVPDLHLKQAARRSGTNVRRARRLAAQVADPVPAAVYAAIQASGPCVYCGAPAEVVDHVRPLSRGGWEHEDNLVPACRPCNSSKADRLLTEWSGERVVFGAARSLKVAAEYGRLVLNVTTVASAPPLRLPPAYPQPLLRMPVNRKAAQTGMLLYGRIADDIAAKIAGGVYPPRSRLPSMTDLCGLYEVARMTASRAIKELVDRDLVIVVQGKGVYVTDHAVRPRPQQLADPRSLAAMSRGPDGAW